MNREDTTETLQVERAKSMPKDEAGRNGNDSDNKWERRVQEMSRANATDMGENGWKGCEGRQRRSRQIITQPLENHQLLFSSSIQWTTSRRRSRADLIGSSFDFSCSSIGNTCTQPPSVPEGSPESARDSPAPSKS